MRPDRLCHGRRNRPFVWRLPHRLRCGTQLLGGLAHGTGGHREIGTVKHEIVYLGDTPNTTARIEQACRDFERTFLASGDVVEAVTIPDGIAVESLGPIELRGVGTPLELFALDR